MNIIKEYRAGKRCFAGANLGCANLHSAYLSFANLSFANLRGADLSGADLSGADLSGASLRHANLSGVNLGGANLSNANLRQANLSNADLRGASLIGASLIGANLIGANLGKQWIIQGPVRSDGYAFFLHHLTGEIEPMLRAGCRYFSMQKAREYWSRTDYPNKELAAESLAILDCLEKLAQIRQKIGE